MLTALRQWFDGLDHDYVPPANETPAMRRMREWLFVLLLSPPWVISAAIIVSAREGSPEFIARIPVTQAQMIEYCAKEATKWTFPAWRDPACK